MHYVMSDLHGAYRAYQTMLEKIRFSEDDILYILGDIVDRGPEPILILQDLLTRSNVICLAGNHEVMAMECFRFLLQDITEESLEELSEETIAMVLDWQCNGGESTMAGMQKLSKERREEILELIGSFDLYEEVEIKGQNYVLVHAGLGGFSPEKPLEDYQLNELVWHRTDYSRPYYLDQVVITGHTPTMNIPGNPKPGYIDRATNQIAIDCGAGVGGRLGCLCLETGEEL